MINSIAQKLPLLANLIDQHRAGSVRQRFRKRHHISLVRERHKMDNCLHGNDVLRKTKEAQGNGCRGAATLLADPYVWWELHFGSYFVWA